MSKRAVDCVWEARAGCGEGPIWDHRTRQLWWVDISGEKIHAFAPHSGEKSSFDAPCLISSIALGAGGGLLIASARGICAFDARTGTLTPLHDPEPGLSGNRLNDMIAGPDGRLWAGTMSEGAKRSSGALYCYDAKGPVHEMTGTTISNGLGWSPDGARLYFIDSVPGVLHVCESGSWRELLVFDDTLGKPDGMTVDAEGVLWVAICDRGKVVGLSPEGKLLETIDIPCQIVTSCAFGGSDLRTLYVTTGTFSMSAEEKAANPLAGGLFAVRMDTPGVEGFEARWPHRST
ncbi:SMP-30/gluconolactonase/LRE family protein [Vannielia litorea]|uniref:Sugar lactone lactonase YvrE n=1 Tax=Vannielia litorea TaxID=1217970 RepID=A0A1N6DZQ6_9RHOB|nr:SMP-30/gluconolactonase/LRE family protein [Vannielia litorea]SIN76265.1 Sugar lactone lactonase YvrE [Vannielia litorea]